MSLLSSKMNSCFWGKGSTVLIVEIISGELGSIQCGGETRLKKLEYVKCLMLTVVLYV